MADKRLLPACSLAWGNPPWGDGKRNRVAHHHVTAALRVAPVVAILEPDLAAVMAGRAAAIDWATEGPRYRDRIPAALEARAIPRLSETLVTCRIFTPQDFADTLGAHLGSAFSLEPILTQSAYFRCHNRDDRIDNLYLVGAGTHPGAGVPGVVASARATARLALADLGLPAAAH